ncbi:M56 family metallopeptidase [Paenibacillus sp. VCA1]|uniref:M56 family metallopeptidase n=1 Tax=Paenibacillus sp. VCA1 TaxID=3039148 RepID=UPI0028723EBB|nr:M56 family metallopeptidase [Paenibacillus sp. VCA1]MDR9853566.1 M56 family metallopeptidase [Paenibacillus sp. VCA1]
MSVAETLFGWFALSTLTASLAAVLVMAVQHVLRRRISARLRYALWLIVLARLMLPVVPESPVSLFNMMPEAADIKKAVSGLLFSQDEPATEAENSKQNTLIQPHYTTKEHDGNIPQTFLPQDSPKRAAAADTESHPAVRVLSVVWLAGTAIFLTYHFVYLLRMKRKHKNISPVSEPVVLNVVEECRGLFSIKREVSVYSGRWVRSPYITGIRRPAVYLPEGFGHEREDAARLKHVIAHELAHYKRKDMAWNMLGSLVLAVHWMNPFAWLIIRRMKADRELACDACVLEALGETEAVAYGMTIISFLKRYSLRESQPQLLYFKGLTGEKDIVRRIRMIQSYKKGSYKFSMLAILLMLLIGTLTLTNGKVTEADGAEWVHAERGGNEVLFPENFREYDNLEKAARMAPFPFKVPAKLPEGYHFDAVTFDLKPHTSSADSEIRFDFLKSNETTTFGHISLNMTRGSGLQEAYERIAESEKGNYDEKAGLVVEKEPIALPGVNGLKITLRMTGWKGQPEQYYYVWKDQGVTYQMKCLDRLPSSDLETMISSMKSPDAELNHRYENNDYHGKTINYLFDTDDIRRAQKLIGYDAAFPRRLPGGFIATGSYVSRKVNFNYPENQADSMRKLLAVTYNRKDQDKTNKEKKTSGIKSVKFTQMLDGQMYGDMKKGNTVSFERIDGERHQVKLQPILVGGREVLRSDKYKVDGPLSSPNETDLVSYFWLDEGVCYQAQFTGQGPEEQKIVQYLMERK